MCNELRPPREDKPIPYTCPDCKHVFEMAPTHPLYKQIKEQYDAEQLELMIHEVHPEVSDEDEVGKHDSNR
jgi:hypothetical protein